MPGRRSCRARTFLTTFRIDDDPTRRHSRASVLPTCRCGGGYGTAGLGRGSRCSWQTAAGLRALHEGTPRPAILDPDGACGPGAGAALGPRRGATVHGTPLSGLRRDGPRACNEPTVDSLPYAGRDGAMDFPQPGARVTQTCTSPGRRARGGLAPGELRPRTHDYRQPHADVEHRERRG